MELSEKDRFRLEVMREFEAFEPKGVVEDTRDFIFGMLEDLSISASAREKWKARFGDTYSKIAPWFVDSVSEEWPKDPKKRADKAAEMKCNYFLIKMDEDFGPAPIEKD